MKDWLNIFFNRPKLSNIMLIILVGYIIWMVFFDENSLRTHRELNKELKKVETENNHYYHKTLKDQESIRNLKHPDSLEKFAREKYLMKKENEDIFIVDVDSLKSK